jgi:hypothetical protein
VAATCCIERLVREGELLDVHHLKTRIRSAGRPGKLDHARREVHADDLTARQNLSRDPPAQSSWSAGEVEHSHSRLRIDKLDDAKPAARFAALHDLLETTLIGERVAAEQSRKQLLGFQGLRLCHSRSSHIAARSASAFVRPTTCIPTGRPRTGTGSATTGWPVVLNGRVKRARGSRTSVPASTGGATIAVAGNRRASMPAMA